MSYANPAAWADQRFVIDAPLDARVSFIRKTYLHLAVAVAAFVGLEAALLTMPGVEQFAMSMLGGRFSWLIVMGAFMGAAYLAQYWARSATSPGLQYAGLGLYVVAESVIFVPIMLAAKHLETATGAFVIGPAAIITLVVFGGLSAIVFLTKKDFSFLRTFLFAAGWAGMGLIVASIFLGFNLGAIFSAVFVLVACGWILYDTSNVLHHYRTDQHVAASLALFASVALLFWYVLRLVMSFTSRD